MLGDGRNLQRAYDITQADPPEGLEGNHHNQRAELQKNFIIPPHKKSFAKVERNPCFRKKKKIWKDLQGGECCYDERLYQKQGTQ